MLAARPVAIGAAREALELAGGQAEDLAELADRTASPEGGKCRDQRRAIVPVALVHTWDQLFADVAREVEVDVGESSQILVQEAPQRQPACDRIDVGEPGQVADERGDRRSSPAPGSQQRPNRIWPAYLERDLARELEHVVVEQEEARQPEPVDHAQLLLQPCLRLSVGGARGIAVDRLAAVDARGGRRSRPVALIQAYPAQLGQAPRGAFVLGSRIAIAEVLRQVEGQLLGEQQRLADRLGMLREAPRHRPRVAHHVAVVAPAQRLGGIERRVVAERHEGILQLGSGGHVSMDVAAGHAPDPQPPGERRERAVAGAIVTGVGTLQLHVQAFGSERVEQPPGRSLVVTTVTDQRSAGTARQADEALRVVEQRSQVHRRIAELAPPSSRSDARVRVGQRDDPAEVAPAALVANEQGDVAGPSGSSPRNGGAVRRASHVRVNDHVDLGAVDRPHAMLLGEDRKLHRAGDRVVVGQRQRLIAKFAGAPYELLRKRDAIQEGVRRMAVQLYIRCRERQLPPHASWTNQPPGP